MLHESIEGLSVKPDGIYVDVTFGGGGHSAEILKKLKKGKLIGFEQDEEAIDNLQFIINNEQLTKNKGKSVIGNWIKVKENKVLLLKNNFRYIKNFLNYYGISKVDGIIADLGISSHQIDTAERGFSTRFDSELDMRMNKNKKLTARKIINEYQEEELNRIFFNYGEISNAHKLTKAVMNYRNNKEIETTEELKIAIEGCVPKSIENKYFSKVFQAIRIEANDEIEALKDMLNQTTELLESKGRFVVISYHSLEDRLIKNFMKSGNIEGEIKKDFFGNQLTALRQITKKAVVPTDEEVKKNSRARSAKMRIAEKI